jgi:orotidine-5'-phosphate decarboxylase
MDNFADRFIAAVTEKKNPSICGLDPDIGSLPPKIKEKYKGLDSDDAIQEAIFEFNLNLTDAVADIVPAVKPQMAFYEKY